MDRTLLAYGLTAEYDGTVDIQDPEGEEGTTIAVPKFGGGLLATPNGDLDVAEALEEGEGVIVLDAAEHTAVAELLEAYPALHRVAVPAGAEPIVFEGPGANDDYNSRTAKSLKADAASRSIDGAASAKKEDLVVALQEFDLRLAEDQLGELGGTSIDNLVAAAAAREEA